MTTQIRSISTDNPNEVKQFVELERIFLKDFPLFISDFDKDVADRITGKSAYFKNCSIKNFIANDGEQDVARCMALINPKFQKAKNEKIGFIGYFAAKPHSKEHVKTLLDEAERWLKENGVERVIAPYNGSMWYGVGTPIIDFDREPEVPYFWFPPYYPHYFEYSGYSVKYPLWFYTIDLNSEKYLERFRKTQKTNNVEIKYMDKRKWVRDLEIVRKLMNETFEDEWLCCDFNKDEYLEFFNPIKPIYEKENIIIAYVNQKPAGFVIGMPIWNWILRPFKGKLKIHHLIKMLLLRKKYSSVGLICIGVLPEYNGQGIATAMAVKLFEFYRQQGFNEAGYYFVNDDNYPSHALAKKLGGTGKLLAHAYDKYL